MFPNISDQFRMTADHGSTAALTFTQASWPARRKSRESNLRKLYLQNANHPIGRLVDDYCNLNSLGLGIVDEMLLNRLLGEHKHLRRLEIKVREELSGGELIANRTIKLLTVHSLGIRSKNVREIVRACKTVEVLVLLNCRLTPETVGILIENDCLRTLDIQNDYWDDDIESGRLIGKCFERCSHLTNGSFRNVNLTAFHPAICSLAERNRNKVYRLHLDDVPENEAFYPTDRPVNEQRAPNRTKHSLPANLLVFELQMDYSY